MKILNSKRAIIGEGPIWNDVEQKLYFTNGFEKEICVYDFIADEISAIKLDFGVSAIAFDKQNNLIVAHSNGVDILNKNGSLTPIYNKTKYSIKNCNDMKVSPNGDIFVGTMSTKRKSPNKSELDGKLYKISKDGVVTVLLDHLSLSNGLDWSVDETKFYHTDSDTCIIKEYNYDKVLGNITPTNRQVEVHGVDGFTISEDGYLYIGCWGHDHVIIVDTATLKIVKCLTLSNTITTSCAFCGKNLDVLAVTTTNLNVSLSEYKNAGFTHLIKLGVKGRKPYRFGENND